MAKALYTGTLDKYDDWSAVTKGGMVPASGEAVQTFLKSTLENKFGYIKYIKNEAGAKYYLFADERNYRLWDEDQVTYASFVLGTFDAPAPATVRFGKYNDIDTPIDSYAKTIKLGTPGQKIEFNYQFKNTNGDIIPENAIMTVTFSTGSNSDRFTQVVNANAANLAAGQPVSIDIDKYLSKAATYTITVQVTGSSTQVSSRLTYTYSVVDLQLKVDFDNTEGKSQDGSYIQVKYSVFGAQSKSKIMDLYIDGEPLYQGGLGWEGSMSNGQSINGTGDSITNQELNLYIKTYKKDGLGDTVCWPSAENDWQWADGEHYLSEENRAELGGKPIFSTGKHSLQMRVHILSSDDPNSEPLYSDNIYMEFVVDPAEGEETSGKNTYLLYSGNLGSTGEVFDPNEPIKVTAKQFSTVEFLTTVYITGGGGGVSQIDHRIIKLVETDEPGTYKEVPILENQPQNCASGETDTFNYTFRDFGKNIKLYISSVDSNDVIEVDLNILESNAKPVEASYAIFKYSALNKSNSSPNKDVWTNETNSAQLQHWDAKAEFDNNVLFIDGQTGWDKDNNALKLNNGAKVTFPINLFAPVNLNNEEVDIASSGFTFEMEFETSNVLDDNARILDYSSQTDISRILVTATSAEITSQGGHTIKTNFKENERIKLAFIINPLRDVENNKVVNNGGFAYPNTLMIMVNGVLDRACKWGEGQAGSDAFKWRTGGDSFTIGDLDNSVTVNFKSLRIYNSPLSFNEELDNYIFDAEGDDVTNLYEKNDVLTWAKNDKGDLERTNDIDFETLKGIIPTLEICMNYDEDDSALNKTPAGEGTKKRNHVATVQFWDPKDPGLNFFAKNVYMSCQGTSSMNYPTKNLRMYFGKTMNKNFYGNVGVNKWYDHESKQLTDSIADDKVIVSEFETEFWPHSVYGSLEGYEDNMRIYADNLLPYSINKKVDGPDGSDPCSFNDKVGEVHEGYHKVGSNRLWPKKLELVKNYMKCRDEFWEQENPKDPESPCIMTTHAPEFYILKVGSKPVIVKDAFDKKHALYASNGFKGYIDSSNENESFNDENKDKYIARTIDNFQLVHITSDYLIEELPKGDTYTSVEEWLKAGNDIFISAYRPLATPDEPFDTNGASKALWEYERELRYSGAKFYTREEEYEGTGSERRLVKVTYKETKKKKPLSDKVFYFSLGSYWRQYNEITDSSRHVSGWTDRWTLKADFAESSMTHNAGIGRLWTEALRAVSPTLAQSSVIDKADGKPVIDIRTGCDGKPIVMFYRELIGYDNYNGDPVYGDRRYGGLFNIMTDKSSTKLFGFEDIYNEDAVNEAGVAKKPIFDASNVQCWECLSNSSTIPLGITTKFDNEGEVNLNDKGNLGNGRPIFVGFEARFPDSGQERHEYNPDDTTGAGYLGNNWPDDTYGVETNKLESFLRWLNFCKPAVDYKIGDEEIDGYTASTYTKFETVYNENDVDNPSQPQDTNTALYYFIKYTNALRAKANAQTATELDEANNDLATYNIYLEKDADGNISYLGLEDTIKLNENDQERTVMSLFDIDNLANTAEYTWYRLNQNINWEKVSKTVTNKKIEDDIYIIPVPGFDAKNRCGQYNENGMYEINQEEQNNYMVKVYAMKSRSGYLSYYDEFGNKVEIAESQIDGFDEANFEKTSDGRSWKGRTYMEYFNATWRNHLDPRKVAAYYIYITRFGAVDQVVKNTMLTTENGEQWYFINYDNDTILGVRNDGHLVYNWDLTRETWGGAGYAYAGNRSILWNTLEVCDDFMSTVRDVDKELFNKSYLSADAVLEWLNEKQMNSWCERLYNYQEEKKYISTFINNFSLTNYLDFTQGTRESHRKWWITRRWEIYDAKWDSGLYDSQGSQYYMNQTGQIGMKWPICLVTAASDYTFKFWVFNQDAASGEWDKFLKRGETMLFCGLENSDIMNPSDPFKIFGLQKAKVLNFRPLLFYGSGKGANAWNFDSESIHWFDQSGSLITKILIGSNDGSKQNDVESLQAINNIYSLEELDIRHSIKLKTAALTNLMNLHRFRAIGSALNKFQPAIGANLYEVSLPSSLSTLTLNKTIFRADPSEYEVLQSDFYSYEDPDGTTASEKFGNFAPSIIDQLPSYGALSHKYCKNYVEDENGVPSLVASDQYVFDYTPTGNLTDVTFNNVVGIDTYTFFNDWYDAVLAKVPSTFNQVTDKRGNTYMQCPYSSSLTGLQWVFENDDENGITAAEKFVQMYYKFNWSNFTGTVYLKDFDTDAYELLVEEFGNDIFKPSSSQLVVTTSRRTYFKVIDTPNAKPITKEDGSIDYYEVVGGTTIELQADIFPVSKTTDYMYTLSLAEDVNAWYNTAPGTLLPQLDNTKTREEFGVEYDGVKGISLKNANGIATLTTADNESGGDSWWTSSLLNSPNAKFVVAVYGYKENGEIDYGNNKLNTGDTATSANPIYVRFVEKRLPDTNNIKLKVSDGADGWADMPNVIVDQEPRTLDGDPITVKVDFGRESNYNVNPRAIYVSFSNTVNNQNVYVRTDNGNPAIVAKIEKANNRTDEFNLYYDLDKLSTSTQAPFELPIYVTTLFDDTNMTPRAKMFTIKVKCNYASTITLSKDGIEYMPNGETIIINDLSIYALDVNLLNNEGVHVNTGYSISSRWTGLYIPSSNRAAKIDVNNGMSKSIVVNTSNAVTNTDVNDEFTMSTTLEVTAEPSNKDLATVICNFPVRFEISMPNSIRVSRGRLENDPASDSDTIVYSSGSGANPFNINLTMSEIYNGAGEPANPTYPVKIEFAPISKNNNIPSVSNVAIVIDSITIDPDINSIVPPTITYDDSETLMNDLASANGIQFGINDTSEDHPQQYVLRTYGAEMGKTGTQYSTKSVTINAGTDSTTTVESVTGLYLSINPSNVGKATTAEVTITMHAEYDITELDEDYEVVKTPNQTFKFNISRSTNTAVSYRHLKHVDAVADKYTLYAVDNKNRFFEFEYDETNGIKATFTDRWGNDQTAEMVTGNKRGVKSDNLLDKFGDWRGVGFVTADGIPLFISFIQYYGYQLAGQSLTTNSSDLGQPWVKLQLKYRDNDELLYAAHNSNTANGYEMTSIYAEFDEGFEEQNMFYEVFNKLNDMKLYIPSIEEVQRTLTSSMPHKSPSGDYSGYVTIPSGELLALNELVRWMKGEGSGSVHRCIYDVDINVVDNTSEMHGTDDRTYEANDFIYDVDKYPEQAEEDPDGYLNVNPFKLELIYKAMNIPEDSPSFMSSTLSITDEHGKFLYGSRNSVRTGTSQWIFSGDEWSGARNIGENIRPAIIPFVHVD